MATEKPINKRSTKHKKGSVEKTNPVKQITSGLLEEVERTSQTLAGEVKAVFDTIVERVSNAATSAAATTASVADKVNIKEPTQLFWDLVEELKEAGETSARVISERFEALREQVSQSTKTTAEAPAVKKKGKTTAKKKATTKKKAVTKKKVTVKKKSTAKKSTAKKKASAKRKKVAVKKSTPK